MPCSRPVVTPCGALRVMLCGGPGAIHTLRLALSPALWRAMNPALRQALDHALRQAQGCALRWAQSLAFGGSSDKFEKFQQD